MCTPVCRQSMSVWSMTWDTPKSETHVTVARLIERQVSLRWHEAVAIVLEVADVFQRSRISSVPLRDALSLTPAGTIEFEGDAAPTADPVTALADMLSALLPLLPKEPPTQLQLIASTAGPNSVSYKSVDEFSEALGYFERPGRRRILSDVYSRALDVRSERWTEPHAGADTVPASSDAPTRMLPTRDIVSQETVETGDMRQLVESVRQFGGAAATARTAVRFRVRAGCRGQTVCRCEGGRAHGGAVPNS